MKMLGGLLLVGLLGLGCASVHAGDAGTSGATTAAAASSNGATATGVARFPHLEVDVARRQVRVECEAMIVDIPLEFFCVVRGTSDHETVLRTMASPEQIHTGLLMLGLKPGEPVSYSQATGKWSAPRGPALHISCEFERNGKMQRVPAYRMMRNVKTKRPMDPMTWVFVGSRRLEDGMYAANATGYIVSVVNFELTVIDIPALASSANETLEWEVNPEVAPAQGTAVTMIIEPVGNEPATAPTGQRPGAVTSDNARTEPAADHESPIDVVLVTMLDDGSLMMNHQKSDINQIVATVANLLRTQPVTVRVTPQPLAPYDRFEQVVGVLQKTGARVQVAPAPPATEQALEQTPEQIDIDALRRRWQQAVKPHQEALREAAQAHFEVISALRRRQQELIDEADKLQRLIDQLQREYQDLTTPKLTP